MIDRLAVSRIIAAAPLLALAMAGCATLPADPPRLDAPVMAAPALAPTGTTAWGFPVYDVPADPTVRYGTLENGLKFAVMPNATPRGTVSVRMGYDVGYIDEGTGEAGLAHFLEHMAFNGSKNVPEGEMIKLLEREGLAFGADTNASTSFEDTIYKLDLPRSDPKLLDTALMLMRETASELTLDPAAINRERGIIQSETRTRNTFQLRRIKDYIDFVAPGTVFSQRLLTADQNANIDSFRAETLAALYRRFYRPDNATLVVVGDFDPAAAEAQIRERFASWQAGAGETPEVDKGSIDLDRPSAARNFVDPGVPVIVTIDRFAPYVETRDTAADFRRKLLLDLGTAILNRRMQVIANAPNSPIISGNAGVSDFFDVAQQTSFTVQAKEDTDGWKNAVGVAEQEARRLREHGVTAAELREQIANFTTAYRNAADQAAARRNAQLAEGILATVQQERLFVAPATRFALFQNYAPTVTPAMVSEAMAARLDGSAPLIHVSSKAPVAGGDAAILATYRDSEAQPVSAPQQAYEAAFGYSDFGPAGQVVADAAIADLGIRQIRFDNNVRLNLKQTDFEGGRLRFLVRVGSGLIALPADRAAEQSVFVSALGAAAGTGKHSLDELQALLAGRQITYGFSVGQESFQVQGITTMADLPAQMQVSAAYVSDFGYRPEALARWQALVPAIAAQLDATPAGVAQSKVPTLIANGDQRFGVPSTDKLAAVSLETLRADLSGQLAQAPVEISVVGDFVPEQVIAAVASTFGALPDRQAALGDFTAARQARFAADTSPKTLTHAGAADQALVQVFWPTRDDSDAQADAVLSLLAGVFGLELLEEVRERLGATYSPNASSNTSDTFNDFGTLAASIVVAPKDAATVLAAVETIAGRLRSATVDADLLERARRPLLERVTLNRRENAWWLGVASESQLRAERLDRARTLEERLRAVTPAMLQAAARQYLVREKALEVSILPRSSQ